MESIVLGIVYHAGTLTTGTRRGQKLGSNAQRTNVAAGVALSTIFDLANTHRHYSPFFHLAGDDIARIIESLQRANIPCAVFTWHAPVNDRFANLGSRAFAELREQINSGLRSGSADDLLAQEMEVFKPDDSSGKIRYPSPDIAAEALGRYPARALAMLLANQYEGAPATEYRPLAGGPIPLQRDSRGHEPYSGGGHKPF